ncbi:MAG: LamG-like jellyroll fold domain-containing protein [Kiritimatiellia bacterium]
MMKKNYRYSNKCFVSVAVFCIGIFSVQLHAGVYDDCEAWWHFDYDADDDGHADLDEIRDQRYWTESSGRHATAISGPLGGPGWTNMPVVCPAGGQNYGNKSMYFNPAVDPATSNCYPVTFKATTPLAGSATIVTRFYWEGIATEVSNCHMGWLYNNKLEWPDRGWMFGVFNESYPCLRIYAIEDQISMDASIKTNTWYDVAVVLTDGGINTPTDTVEFYLWEEGGSLVYESHNTTVITNSISAGDVVIGAEYATSGYSSSNGRKAFKGAVNHLAVWDRALSFDEVNEAFGHPRPLFQIGLKNNNSNDMRAETSTDAEYRLGDPWHTMRRAVTLYRRDATIKLELDAIEAALDYGFHLRTYSSQSSQSVQIELIVNDFTYPEQAVGPFQDYHWYIPGSELIEGTNTFTLHYANGPASYISFDWMEISGSWQVGYEDFSSAEFANEGDAPDDFYVTDPNWMHLERAVTSYTVAGDPLINIHFTLSSEMIDQYTYDYTTRLLSQGIREGGTGNHAFTIGCNDTVVQSYPEGLPDNTLFSVSMPRELLVEGDNVINIIYDSENGEAYSQFDFHRLELQQQPAAGTFIFVF